MAFIDALNHSFALDPFAFIHDPGGNDREYNHGRDYDRIGQITVYKSDDESQAQRHNPEFWGPQQEDAAQGAEECRQYLFKGNGHGGTGSLQLTEKWEKGRHSDYHDDFAGQKRAGDSQG